MVGVDVVGVLPAAAADGVVGLGPQVVGLRADERVLAERLVPDRHDDGPRPLGLLDRAQLGEPLLAETVADPDGVLFDLHGAMGVMPGVGAAQTAGVAQTT